MGTRTLDISELDEDTAAFIKDLTIENDALAKSLDEATARLEELSDGEVDDDEDDVTKGLDPRSAELVKSLKAEMQTEIAKAHSLAESAIAKAEAETAKREGAEWLAKAAEFSALPVEATALAKALHESSHTLTAESMGTLLTVLAAANEMGKGSTLFSELGKSGAGDTKDDGTSELHKAAVALQSADPALSYPDAISKAVKVDPSLYNDYRKAV